MTPEEARNELIRNHGWAGSTVDVWVRAGGCCEYCKTDLLSSSDPYFHGSHLDHIVPDSGNDPNNLALSCAACNRRKRSFDPRRTDAPNQARLGLLDAARSYIFQLRDRDEERRRAAVPALRACGMKRPEVE